MHCHTGSDAKGNGGGANDQRGGGVLHCWCLSDQLLNMLNFLFLINPSSSNCCSSGLSEPADYYFLIYFFRGNFHGLKEGKNSKGPHNCCGDCFCLSDVSSPARPGLNLETFASTLGKRRNIKQERLPAKGAVHHLVLLSETPSSFRKRRGSREPWNAAQLGAPPCWTLNESVAFFIWETRTRTWILKIHSILKKRF